MTATATQPKRPPAPEHPDIAAARLVAREYDFDARSEYLTATIPSRGDSNKLYVVRGHTHGRDATCSCWGFTKWKRCCHAAAFILIIEELERQFYGQEGRYTTARLLDLARYFDNVADILDADQRLRFTGVKAALRDRGVDFRSTRTLAEQAAAVERGRAAKALLFDQ